MSDLFDLSGRVAIVTGASRGLGQYFGRALAKAGADLVITARNKDHLTLASQTRIEKRIQFRQLTLAPHEDAGFKFG